jgi:multiple sugar transport system ATP-binding protein
MVYFTVKGTEMCARVEPTAAKDAGASMTLQANMENMHLIDASSGMVL